MNRGPKPIDLTGKRFNYWTVLGLSQTRTSQGDIAYVCQCRCGTIKNVRGADVSGGHSQSCGCVRHEGRTKTHGKSDSKVYRCWRQLRQRCNNPTEKNWKHYGGRGIKVCERWMKFENFLADMGEPPTPKHSIDRIDNNGNYEPSNCRWATDSEQQRNTRRNRFLTHDGSTKTLVEWATEFGLCNKTISYRLRKGKSCDLAFSETDFRKTKQPGRCKLFWRSAI